MALFDLSNLNPGAWFDYDSESKVLLRVTTAGVLEGIRKKTVKHVKEYKKKGKTGELQLIKDTVIDEQLLKEEVWDYTIVDWQGFKTSKGDLKCNRENKIKLMNGSIDFYNFVDGCLQKLSDDEKKEVEEQEKNLKK